MALSLEGGFPVVVPAVSGASASISQSVTVGSGANRLLVVMFALDNGNVSGTPTFGAANLTKLGGITGGANFEGCECWYLINPATSTATLTAAKAVGTNIGAVIYVFDGADQTAPFRTIQTQHFTSGNLSNTVPGFSAGDYGIDIVSMDGTGSTPAPTSPSVADSSVINFGAGTTEFRAAHNTTSGVMAWTGTAGGEAHVATAVIPASAGGSAPPSRIWPIALAQARRFFPFPPLGFNLRGDFTVPGTVFNDSGSGTITLSGTRTESHSHSNSPSGTITLGGSFAQAFSHSGSASGQITLAGTRTESLVGTDSRAGTITLAGTFTQSLVGTDSRSGTIVLNGTATEDYHPGGTTFNDSGSGTITLSGTRTESLVAADSRTGSITLTGTSSESAAHTASRTGTVTLAGTSNEVWGHVDSGTGTITLAGTRTETHAHVSSATGQLTLFGTSQEDFHGFIPEETTGIRRLKRRRWQPN
jgi:fibronectin-binding autotransporter adhesin